MTNKELQYYRKRKLRMLALIESGLSQSKVASKLCMSRQRVNQILRGK